MAAVAYIRVSSKQQNYEMQRDAIRKEAERRGDTIVEWYAEKASATKTIRRVELDRLRDDVRAGRVKMLYIFCLDRLARTGFTDLNAVLDDLRRAHAGLVSLLEGWVSRDDLGAEDDPMVELLLMIFSWFAKFEGRRRGERIAAARERVEARGGKWGRPHRMDAVTVRHARAMRAAGRSIRWIAAALKHPKSTVQRALSS